MSVDTAPNQSAFVRARALFVAARGTAEKLPLSVIQLAMRIAIGFVFFNSGLLKARSFEFAVKLFEHVAWLARYEKIGELKRERADLDVPSAAAWRARQAEKC